MDDDDQLQAPMAPRTMDQFIAFHLPDYLDMSVPQLELAIQRQRITQLEFDVIMHGKARLREQKAEEEGYAPEHEPRPPGRPSAYVIPEEPSLIPGHVPVGSRSAASSVPLQPFSRQRTSEPPLMPFRNPFAPVHDFSARASSVALVHERGRPTERIDRGRPPE